MPDGFRFSVKLPQAITHDARLHGVGDALSAFLDSVAGLGSKLGGVLVQLPPSLVFDARLANTFFAMLRRRTAVPVACEPRHASWFEPAVDTVWERHAIARVAADPARLPAAAQPGGSAQHWRYWRWHGSPRIYYSQYDDTALAAWPRRCVRARMAVRLPGASSTTPPAGMRWVMRRACRRCWPQSEPQRSETGRSWSAGSRMRRRLILRRPGQVPG